MSMHGHGSTTAASCPCASAKYPFFHISSTRYTSFPLYLFAKYMAALRLLPTASFKRRDCDHEALEQMMLRHRHIVVSGWFVRFYDLFEKYKSEIISLFTIRPELTEPVKAMMTEAEQHDKGNVIRLGVHIRRGDYDKWMDGRFYYDNQVYATHIAQFALQHPGKAIHVYIATNDMQLNTQQLACPGTSVTLHWPKGNSIEDLFMLSECDYIIGPPSTYSLVASMYHDTPIYRMDRPDATLLTPEAFRDFNHWNRLIGIYD